ncbi:MFS transporter [Actinomadura logoneensis]|uniref:MFS transporter n=1 Tax=Actinomadura logoneensis TaxID=2293572 RepID=UPI0018F1C7F1|nr:MFS transporter [Actinomadura logoneensis]
MTTTSTTSPATVAYRDIFAVREFRVLFALRVILVGGDMVRMLALSVLVYQRTGSSLLAALAYTAEMFPYVIGGALLLSHTDRLPPRRLLVGVYLVQSGTSAVLATGVLPVGGTLAVMFALGLLMPLASASTWAMLSEILPGDGGYVLGRSVFTMTAGGAQIAGQACGGLLIAAVGPSNTLWLSCGTAGCAALLARIGLATRPPRVQGERDGGAARETWRVNRALLRDPVVRGSLFAMWLPAALATGAEGVVIPYAASLGKPEQAGFVLAGIAAGMLLGNLVVGRFVPTGPRERIGLLLALLNGLPLVLFALRPGIAVACVLGLAGAAGLSYELSIQQRFVDAVPEDRRGQAFGLLTTGTMTLQSGAMAGAGAIAEGLSPGVTMALFGAASACAALALSRHLR